MRVSVDVVSFKSHSRTLEMTVFDESHDFLLAFSNNCNHILYRVPDVFENREFFTVDVQLTSSLKAISSEFRQDVWC